MDGFLKELLDHLVDAVKLKWDGIVVLDGMEGSGKTTLGFICADYVDPNFNLDNVVFTFDQFIKAVENAKPGTAIVWDEFVTAGLSDDYMTKMQKTLVKKMTMIRKKHLYIFLVVPYFFMLKSYFAVARSRFLLHSYTPDGLRRGVWHAWNYDRKKQLYFRGRKEYNYNVVPKFRQGTFTNFWNTDKGKSMEAAYEAKKDAAEASLNKDTLDNKGIMAKKWKKRFIKLAKLLVSKGESKKNIAKEADIKPTNLSKAFEDFKEEAET